MKFNSETYEVIRQRILDNMSNDIDKREGSFVSNMISPVSVEFAKYYMELDNILAIMVPGDNSELKPKESIDIDNAIDINLTKASKLELRLSK